MYSAQLKLILVCLALITALRHDFMISYVGHLENIGVLGYADLPNVVKCYTVSEKSHSLVSLISERYLKFWDAF